MDDIIDVDSPEQRIAMRKRHLELALRMQAVAIAALKELEQKATIGKPLELTAEDAKALLDTGAKLESAVIGGERQNRKPN